MRKLTLAVFCLTHFLISDLATGQPKRQSEPTPRQLETWLRQYPEADANQDGQLTVEEARQYQRRLQRQRANRNEPPAYDFRTQFTFAEMSDGVSIALAVGFPREYDPADTSRKWPAIFEMMGYPDSTIAQSPDNFGNRYVTVRASVRGAGASGGTIRAISPRTGRDGYEIIEDWIVKQPWSNGKVAMHGHSWGGLTGFMIAATNPPHLSAVAVSGLLDDIYRDIGRIGGIRNSGFPVNWLINLYKPSGPFDSGEAAIRAREMSRGEYTKIVAGRPPWELSRSVLWNSLHGEIYEPEFAEASPGTYASGVRAPIHIMHAYQDEQTGPSGVWLWNAIPDDVPKRLVLSNGDHGDVGHFNAERMRWLDFWTLQDARTSSSEFTDSERRVQVYFETPTEGAVTNPPLVASDFPLPETSWIRYYMHDEKQLRSEMPAADETGGDAFSVAVGRGDDVEGQHYSLTFEQPTAICGPICVTLWLTCTTVDTDVYVMVADVASEGTVQMLQRGLLRASHQQIDQEQSLFVENEGQSVLVRPRHVHRDFAPVRPGEPFKLNIEVFPVGHVFRTGHQLALWISQPPLGDPVTRHGDGEPAYKYESAMPPARVMILRDREHPSSVLLPVLPHLPPISDQPLAPGQQAGIHIRP